MLLTRGLSMKFDDDSRATWLLLLSAVVVLAKSTKVEGVQYGIFNVQ